MEQIIPTQRLSFAAGTLRWKATITTPNGVTPQQFDQYHQIIGEHLFARAISTDGFYAEAGEKSTSYAKQRSILEYAGIVVDIEAVLTIRRPDIDQKVADVLAHGLAHLATLPTLIKQKVVEQERMAEYDAYAKQGSLSFDDLLNMFTEARVPVFVGRG